nr:hypothetical protein [Bradyrhizobium sp. JYMT SZCCT0428]
MERLFAEAVGALVYMTVVPTIEVRMYDREADGRRKPKDPLLHLYIDESGPVILTSPERKLSTETTGLLWAESSDEDLATVKRAILDFKKQWPKIKAPLHFTDMRAKKKNFAWLGTLEQKELNRFWSSYRTFLADMPVSGTACVIDRPGYIGRGYGKREGDTKWLLCRSAFDILLERSAKLARMQGRRLNLFRDGRSGH